MQSPICVLKLNNVRMQGAHTFVPHITLLVWIRRSSIHRAYVHEQGTIRCGALLDCDRVAHTHTSAHPLAVA